MRPRFYCETCGTEVPLDLDRCPHCLSLFVSVQCPRCRHQGKAELFVEGCPQCGFQPPADQPLAVLPAPRRTPAGWPRWVYRLLVTALTAVLVILVGALLSR